GHLAHTASLTHQQLQDAHATCYLPGNASEKRTEVRYWYLQNFATSPAETRFFTNGHLPLEYHMEFIDSSLVEFIQVEPSVGEPLEPCWKKPRSKHDYKLRP
ncbi:hypothetical protein RRG08_047011, partial [Elysia crispata]